MKVQTIILAFCIAALLGACGESGDGGTKGPDVTSADAAIVSMSVARFPVTLGAPGLSAGTAFEGSVAITGPWADAVIPDPKFQIIHSKNADIEYAVGTGAFAAARPRNLTNGDILWVKVSSMDQANESFYKIKVSVQQSAAGYGAKDAAWASDSYNAEHRVFPNAPEYGILTYPWGSGTNNYFDQNAPPSYWNGKGHNHKYPDPFHFANGNKVETVADWENRRAEIYNILQYYMHGRMPSIDTGDLTILWREMGNNVCRIDLAHRASGRTARIEVTHTPPADAGADKSKILMFGMGGAPNRDRHPGWGTAAFQTAWGGSENDRTGLCATLYGFSTSAADTPSVNMEYAWAMSVILTVIEQGGLGGYYDPAKVGVYGFSRWGKAAMCIGAFAESRGGNRIGQTFIGSAGSGGPVLDRFIAQAGYKSFNEDPLPANATGITAGAGTNADLTSIVWYQQQLDDTAAAGNNNRAAVRAWTTTTPGIPAGSLIYNETVNYTVKPYLHTSKGPVTDPQGIRGDWGGIEVLAESRRGSPGWFCARFSQLSDLHGALDLDHDYDQTTRAPSGVVCTMPFDSHFLAALIAPRIMYFEDGYATTRNNPEAQWANWLLTDEVYQFYAEQQNNDKIIWRNAIKMYHIPHMHQTYQDTDEYDLTQAVYAGGKVDDKFRTPPFPADDPRYRWDFDRMDIGRPGHPAVAERVRLMRESPVRVKAVDTRGLLDSPEPLN